MKKICGKGKTLNSKVKKWTSIALLLAFLFLFLPSISGCTRVRGFTIKKEGIVIGSERVEVERSGDVRTYRSTLRRPYLEYDTTVEQKISFSQREGLISFTSSVKRNGPSFKSYIKRSAGGTYKYIRNGLQTFEQFGGIKATMALFAIQRDSACSLMVLLDGLLSSGKKKLRVATIIPSEGSALRETFLVITGKGKASFFATGFQYRVSFNDRGEILEAENKESGLKIEAGWPGRLTSKPYIARAISKDVIVTSNDGYELSGSLILPKGKPPYKACVLVGDEGPQDRTGCGFLSGLADGLSKEGFAVLTCDRRGVAESKGNYSSYTLETEIADTLCKVDYLVMRGEIDVEHIGIIGYGEGGIAAASAATQNPYVKACVLIATPSVPVFPDLMRIQLEERLKSGEISEIEFKSAIASINYLLSLLKEAQDWIKIEGYKLFLGWMRSHANSEMMETVGALQVPVLVVHGTDDRVVPFEQGKKIFDALKERKGYTSDFLSLKGLGHELGNFIGEAKSKPERAHVQIDKRAIDGICRWAKQNI